MEMELCKGEIQAHCTDVSDSALALARSVLSMRDISILKSSIEFLTYNEEQYRNLNRIIDEVMSTFTDYYYAAGEENYLEHPYYHVILKEGEIVEDYHEKYYDNNPLFNIEYEKLSDTTTRIMFSVKDKDKCLQALDEYCSKYGYDELCNDETNLLICEAQDKQLYNLLTENDYNLNNFVVTEQKYIKALCYNEFKNKLCITNVAFDFDDNNKLKFKCTIADEGFVEEFKKDNIEEDVNTEIQKLIDIKPANKKVAKLTDIEKQVISARAYLQEYSGKLRISYKDIASFLTNNGIYMITENNIKQKVSSIYAKLDIQDLGTAVVMLREANALIEYDNVKV